MSRKLMLLALLPTLACGIAAVVVAQDAPDNSRKPLAAQPALSSAAQAPATQPAEKSDDLVNRFQSLRRSIVDQKDQPQKTPGVDLSPSSLDAPASNRPTGNHPGTSLAPRSVDGQPSSVQPSNPRAGDLEASVPGGSVLAPSSRLTTLPSSPTLAPNVPSQQVPHEAAPLTSRPVGVAPAIAPTLAPSLAPTAASTSDQGFDGRASARRTNRQPLSAEPTAPSTTVVPSAPTENALIAGRTPSLAMEMVGPKVVTIGKPLTIVMTIANTSDVPASDVAVNIGLPSSAEVVANEASSGTARHQVDGGTEAHVTWGISRLVAGGKERLTLKLVPRDGRPLALPTTWTCAASGGMAQIQVQEPKLQIALTGPRDILYGESRLYTITITNPGTGDAQNVVVGLQPTTAGQRTTGARTIGVVPAGGKKTMEVELTAQQAGPMQIVAVASADGDLRCEATEEVMVRRARLEVVAIGPTVKYAGTPAVYQLRARNTGDAAAEKSVASVVLPRGVKFAAASEGGKYSADDNTVRWTIGSLRPSGETVLELTCSLESAGDITLEMLAEAEGGIAASHSTVTKVEALADLKLHVSDPQGPVALGEKAVYQVRIHNRGTKAAESINITAFFSEGVEPLSAENHPSQVSPGQVNFEPIKRIEAGQEITLKIVARGDKAGSHIFRVEVRSSEPVTRLAAEETTRFYSTGTSNAPVTEEARRPLTVPSAQPHPAAPALGPASPAPLGPAPLGPPSRFN